MSDTDRLLNEIDEAKIFAKRSGMVPEEGEVDYLKTIQAQILKLFWKQSTRLLTGDLNLEVQHLILQDTVQMAKILKDWSLGDKTLDIKNKSGLKDLSAAELIDQILQESSIKKDGKLLELPIDKIKKIEDMENNINIEDLGITKSIKGEI